MHNFLLKYRPFPNRFPVVTDRFPAVVPGCVLVVYPGMPPGASARGAFLGAEGFADFGTENAFFSFFLPRPAPKDRIRPDSVCSMIRRPGDRREDRAECSGDFFGPRGRKPPGRTGRRKRPVRSGGTARSGAEIPPEGSRNGRKESNERAQ